MYAAPFKSQRCPSGPAVARASSSTTQSKHAADSDEEYENTADWNIPMDEVMAAVANAEKEHQAKSQ